MNFTALRIAYRMSISIHFQLLIVVVYLPQLNYALMQQPKVCSTTLSMHQIQQLNHKSLLPVICARTSCWPSIMFYKKGIIFYIWLIRSVRTTGDQNFKLVVRSAFNCFTKNEVKRFNAPEDALPTMVSNRKVCKLTAKVSRKKWTEIWRYFQIKYSFQGCVKPGSSLVKELFANFSCKSVHIHVFFPILDFQWKHLNAVSWPYAVIMSTCVWSSPAQREYLLPRLAPCRGAVAFHKGQSTLHLTNLAYWK